MRNLMKGIAIILHGTWIVVGLLVGLAVLSMFLVYSSIWWLFGGRIVIKRDDKPIGYLRWFKYTRTV